MPNSCGISIFASLPGEQAPDSHDRLHSILSDLDHTDVDGTATIGDYLYFDGTNWTPNQIEDVGDEYTQDVELDSLTSDSESYTEFTYSGKDVTQITSWTDSTKSSYNYIQEISYNGNKATSITTKHYRDGVLYKTVIESLTYSGNQITSTEKTVT
jgi:hypothetical protein